MTGPSVRVDPRDQELADIMIAAGRDISNRLGASPEHGVDMKLLMSDTSTDRDEAAREEEACREEEAGGEEGARDRLSICRARAVSGPDTCRPRSAQAATGAKSLNALPSSTSRFSSGAGVQNSPCWRWNSQMRSYTFASPTVSA